ncbi:hypothetical protein MY5147_009503 [Beauveria neobassiana]
MRSAAEAKGYRPVDAAADETGDWDADLTRREARLAQREKRCRAILFGNALVFFLSLCFLAMARLSKPSLLECDKMTSPYSPVFNGGVEHWEGDFENTFNQTSKYRGPPTLELENAWEELWYQPGVGLTLDDIAKLNKTRAGVSFTEIEGSDPKNPTYASTLEVFHQLHCLSLIRQATWPLRMFNESWHSYPWFLTDKLGGRMHVDHCLESLRLSLMCYADVTPVLAENNPMRPTGLQLDFNVHHKCRNYDKLLEHVQAHGVDVPAELKNRLQSNITSITQ